MRYLSLRPINPLRKLGGFLFRCYTNTMIIPITVNIMSFVWNSSGPPNVVDLMQSYIDELIIRWGIDTLVCRPTFSIQEMLYAYDSSSPPTREELKPYDLGRTIVYDLSSRKRLLWEGRPDNQYMEMFL